MVRLTAFVMAHLARIVAPSASLLWPLPTYLAGQLRQPSILLTQLHQLVHSAILIAPHHCYCRAYHFPSQMQLLAKMIGGDTSFRVNLDWTPNEDTLMYFSVTTGYRAGGYSLGIGDSRGPGNFGGVTPLTYDQEEVTAYEIGYKGTFLDGQPAAKHFSLLVCL